MNYQVININGVDCYEEDGTAYLRLEDVARGLGFTKTEVKGVTEYTTIRWERVFGFLDEIGFDHKWAKDAFIPENIFYRLAMKAKNEVAEAFQAKIADEVIPSIRKHGAYMTEVTIDNIIANPDFGIKLLMELKAEQEKRRQLEKENEAAKPKVEYFDDLVDRKLLTNFRDTAKEFGIKEREFIRLLEDHGYIYRDSKKRIKPIAEYVTSGLFEIKDTLNSKNRWVGNQTFITPKGKSTLQLLVPIWLKRQAQRKLISK